MNETSQHATTVPAPQLGLWDAVSIIVGIVVGVSIFSEASPIVFSNVSGPWMGIGAWVLGGVLSLVGALCYAELATTYPRSGGDYVYLTRAYGPLIGFLFGWAQLAAILTGSLAAMAYVFADHSIRLWNLDTGWAAWFAGGVIVIMSVTNLFGVVFEKRVQNVLTVTKVLGLAAVLVAGFFFSGGGSAETVTQSTGGTVHFGMAMIFVLYAYGGWNDAAFVAAEVRHGRRNIPLALLLGTAGIMVIYVAINLAYLNGLGFGGLRNSGQTPSADILELMLGNWGSRGMSLLVMISALGAVNGIIFTGSRVYTTLGEDYSVFSFLGRWQARLGSPVAALAAQAVISLSMIVAVGTEAGRTRIDGALRRVGLDALPWGEYHGGFGTLVTGTAPVFWLFFLMTGLAVIHLRVNDRETERPFSIPLYPFVPIVFCLSCAYMLYSSIAYAGGLCLLGIVPLLCGVPLYAVSRRKA